MNLNTLIDQWIGEDVEKQTFFEGLELGYNLCKKDLKSRKQELIDGIVKLMEKYEEEEYNNHEYCPISECCFRGFGGFGKLIKELTDK